MESLQLILLLAVVLIVVAGGFFIARRTRPEQQRASPLPAVASVRGRLGKSRASLGQALRAAFGRGSLDEGFWDSIEEALVGADMGLGVSAELVERIRRARPESAVAARELLVAELRTTFDGAARSLDLDGSPAVVLVVGVNGSGKTTSIAKLAERLRVTGHRPLLAAADTFRAAADSQLRTWADRVGVEVVGGREGSDPAAVAFDALQAARARDRDVLIVDTAGRLQSKKHLMQELAKIRRVLEREGGRIAESLLVLDATSGQNGIAQVREFALAVGLTGIVLAKLDGTARGGIVVAVEQEFGVPVKFVGVGEGLEDLVPFDPDEFVEELLAEA